MHFQAEILSKSFINKLVHKAIHLQIPFTTLFCYLLAGDSHNTTPQCFLYMQIVSITMKGIVKDFNDNFKILIKALDCLREGEEIPNPYSFSLSHTSKTTKSSDIVPDLQNTMYAFIDGYPCVRLMNLSGTISCSSESPRSLILSLSSINLRVLRINCKLNI